MYSFFQRIIEFCQLGLSLLCFSVYNALVEHRSFAFLILLVVANYLVGKWWIKLRLNASILASPTPSWEKEEWGFGFTRYIFFHRRLIRSIVSDGK